MTQETLGINIPKLSCLSQHHSCVLGALQESASSALPEGLQRILSPCRGKANNYDGCYNVGGGAANPLRFTTRQPQ